VYLTRIERSLDEIDRIVENKVARAGTMATNAYSDCKQILGSMRAATAYLRGGPAVDKNSNSATAPPGPREEN